MSWAVIFPIALILLLGAFFIFEYIPAARAGLPGTPEAENGAETLPQPKARGRGTTPRLTQKDRLLCLGIVLVYAVVAFTGLGDKTAPQSFCKFRERGEYALIELRESQELSALMYYSGLYSGEYRLQFSADGENWQDQTSMTQDTGDLFKWQYAELAEERGEVKYVRIIAGSELWLGEVALYDADGNLISAEELIYDEGTATLFDEQELVPDAPSYLNSAYFDEIYHARTAYEHVLDLEPYEVSHPPLGKLIISIGIRLFGMTPFGWRFMGTLFGVAMLPCLYSLLKRLFRSTAIAACFTVVFAFDFMHFTQTRIATIDTYAVFFIILMYLFMYRYLTAPRGEGRKRRPWLKPLALCGLCFGLGAACKWTCIYAGAGLAVIWMLDRIFRFVEQRREGKTRAYLAETGENILWCLLFFIVVPGAIYYVSYWPYGTAAGLSGPGMLFSREYFDIVAENQSFMFSYHSGVTAEHPYSSRWYQWIFDIRPILYYLNYFDDGTRSSFGAFVSPALCWGGFMAIIAMGYMAFFRRDKRALFILVGYLAQLLPWVFITRVTFEYHYFPSTVFLTLALAHVFDAVIKRRPARGKRELYAFAGLSLVLFIVFYPVLSGKRVDTTYAKNFLCWIPGWWPF